MSCQQPSSEAACPCKRYCYDSSQHHIHAHFNYSTRSHAAPGAQNDASTMSIQIVCAGTRRGLSIVSSNCMHAAFNSELATRTTVIRLIHTVRIPPVMHGHHLQTLVSGEITQHTQLQLLVRLCTWPPIVPLLRPLSFNWPCISFIAAVIIRSTISSFPSSP